VFYYGFVATLLLFCCSRVREFSNMAATKQQQIPNKTKTNAEKKLRVRIEKKSTV
jgi:hypothetical protein